MDYKTIHLRYELSDGAHLVFSAVAKEIYADGNSAEDAIVEFRLAVKTRISGGLSELYFGRSEFLYQEKKSSLDWKRNGRQMTLN